MKTLFLLTVTLFYSCNPGNRIAEGEIYKTRIYVGKYISSYPLYACTSIQTTMLVFTIKENPEIPDSALCYIRIKPGTERYPNIAYTLQRQCFSWNGSDKEYNLISPVKVRK
jgi:hypothetical protein